MTETLLTVDDVVARMPRVSDWWVRRELNAGRLRGSKIGRRWFIPESAITELIEATSNQVAPSSSTRRRRRRATAQPPGS